MKWSAQNKLITVGCGVALLFLIALSIVATQSTINVAQSVESNSRSYQRIAALHAFTSNLQTADLAFLSYVATRADENLQACRDAQKSAAAEIQRLRTLAADDPRHLRRLDTLQAQLEKERANLEKRIAQWQQQGFEGAASVVRKLTAESVMPEVKQLVSQMESEEQQLTAERREQAQERAHFIRLAFAVASIVSFALLYVVFWQLDKQIREHKRDKEELGRMKDELEQRVADRTADLTRALDVLRREAAERKSAESALRDSESRYRFMAENMADMIVRKTLEGKFLYVSPSSRALLGYEPEEMVGRSIYDFVHPDDLGEVREAHEQILEGCLSRIVTHRALHKSGRVIWLETNLRATHGLRSDEVTELVAVSRDITKRKRALSELERLSVHLMRLRDDERRRMARELHDTTAQNLSAVTLNLARLQKQLGASDGAPRKVIDETLSLAEQCLREIRTMSYLLHPPMLEEAGLASALRWYVDGFAKRSGIRVDLDLPEMERQPREIERTLFHVVQESLSNVHRHSGSKRASIFVDANKGEVTVEVKDYGKGIAREALNEDGETVKPLGVGIMGMDERLRQLGGRLEVISNGGGTTVRAVLPIKRSSS